MGEPHINLKITGTEDSEEIILDIESDPHCNWIYSEYE